jgi:hypothetical protein
MLLHKVFYKQYTFEFLTAVHSTVLCDKYKSRHLSMSHKSLEKIRDFEGKILGCRSHKACQSNLAVVRKVSLSSNC